MTTFVEIVNRLAANDPLTLTIDVSQEKLTVEQLEKLAASLQHNTVAGRISWGSLAQDNKSKEFRAAIEQRLKMNNVNFRDRPSDYEYALMSEHIYEEGLDKKLQQSVTWQRSSGKAMSLSPEWQLYRTYRDDKNGYVGAAYYHTKQHFLVVSHRGTEPTDTLDVVDDIAIFTGQLTAQQISAFDFTKTMLRQAKEKGWHFSITGHSLGGWLAQVSLLHCYLDLDYPQANAVVFDCFGLKTMFKRLQASSSHYQIDALALDLTVYLSAPNLINTAHPHLARQLRIFPTLDKAGLHSALNKLKQVNAVINNKALKDITDIGKLVETFICGHSITAIVDTFNPNTGVPNKLLEVKNWPQIKLPESVANPLSATVKTSLKGIQKATDFSPSMAQLMNPSQWLACLGQWLGNAAFQYAQNSLGKSLVHWLDNAPLFNIANFMVTFYQHKADLGYYQTFLQLAYDTADYHPEPVSVDNQYALWQEARYHLVAYQPSRVSLQQLPASIRPFVKSYAKYHTLLFANAPHYHPERLGLALPPFTYKSKKETAKVMSELILNNDTLNPAHFRAALLRYYKLHEQTLQNGGLLKASFAPAEASAKLDLDKRRHYLVAYYAAQDKIPTTDERLTLSLAKAYIKPRFSYEITRSLQQASVPDEQKEALPHEKEALPREIELEAMLEPGLGKQLVTITADPGFGKSLLCQFIAWQWAKGALWQAHYDWVFWVKLREIKHTSSGDWLDILLQQPCFEDWRRTQASERQKIKQALQALLQSGKCLVLLDGYDEIAYRKQSHYLDALKVLAQMPQLALIITTRPHAAPELSKLNLESSIPLRLAKFNHVETIQYIQQFYTSNQVLQGDKLIEAIQQSPALAELTRIPLQLSLLCTHWQAQKFETKDINSITFYDYLIQCQLKRYLDAHKGHRMSSFDREDIYHGAQQELCMLEHLAWLASEKQELVIVDSVQETLANITEQDCKLASNDQQKAIQAMFATGLLYAINPSDQDLAKQGVAFLHASFQEFFAARHIVSLLLQHPEKARELIARHKFNLQFNWIWRYVAGLLDIEYQASASGSSFSPMESSEVALRPMTDFLQMLIKDEPQDMLGLYSSELLAACLHWAPTLRDTLLGKHYTAQLQTLLENLWFKPMRAEVPIQAIAKIVNLYPLLAIQFSEKICQPSLQEPIDVEKWQKTVSMLIAIKDSVTYDSFLLSNIIEKSLKSDELVGNYLFANLIRELVHHLQPKQINDFIQPLLAKFNNQGMRVRYNAIGALLDIVSHLQPEQMSLLIKPLLAKFNDENINVRHKAIEALCKIAPYLQPQQMSALIQSLLTIDNKKIEVRISAIHVLGRIAPHLHSQQMSLLLQPLLANVNDKYRWFKGNDIYNTLVTIARYLQPEQMSLFIQALLAKLDDKEGTVRSSAIELLFMIASHLQPEQMSLLLQPLLAMLDDKEWRVRSHAMSLLIFKIAPYLQLEQMTLLLQSLLAKLDDKEIPTLTVLSNGLHGLVRHLQPEHKRLLVQHLLAKLDDEDWKIRDKFIGMLFSIALHLQPEQIRSLLHPVLAKFDDKEYQVRLSAIDMLGEIASHFQPEQMSSLIHPLLAKFEDEDKWVRDKAVVALGKIAPHLQPEQINSLIQPLLAKFDDKEDIVRSSAIGALGSIAPHLQAAQINLFTLPFLTRFDDTEWFVIRKAIETLGKIVTHLQPKPLSLFIKILLSIKFTDSKASTDLKFIKSEAQDVLLTKISLSSLLKDFLQDSSDARLKSLFKFSNKPSDYWLEIIHMRLTSSGEPIWHDQQANKLCFYEGNKQQSLLLLPEWQTNFALLKKELSIASFEAPAPVFVVIDAQAKQSNSFGLPGAQASEIRLIDNSITRKLMPRLPAKSLASHSLYPALETVLQPSSATPIALEPAAIIEPMGVYDTLKAVATRSYAWLTHSSQPAETLLINGNIPLQPEGSSQALVVMPTANFEEDAGYEFFDLMTAPLTPLPQVELNSQLALARVGVYAIRWWLGDTAMVTKENQSECVSEQEREHYRDAFEQQLNQYESEVKRFASQIDTGLANKAMKQTYLSIDALYWLIEERRTEVKALNPKTTVEQLKELELALDALEVEIKETQADYHCLQLPVKMAPYTATRGLTLFTHTATRQSSNMSHLAAPTQGHLMNRSERMDEPAAKLITYRQP